ncbi:polymeric immunoglobulin receptor-like [Coregonus clupeaformis]|uniref:polymeric immunoglobulin receptor-like n=1 Tax=Coregonus clupeaformis TaxID=59861 RepID=UPI001E1C65FB|nr:polymeric immunoglobulin receptor-like [Coregonus clupeaformis]
MALHLSLLLLLLFLILYRVSAGMYVSVQTGGSITIPCHYDQYYINHVKYWCKGYDWIRCSSLVRSDHPKSSGNASISDDINQRVFTVTMTDLEPEDSESYRCVVEINGGSDIMIQWFYLSVTLGTPELYVDQQEVTGVEGGSVTVRCYYSNSGDMKWCRMGGDCVSYSGTLHGTVTLKDISLANNRKVLTVTMSGLKMENTDWYCCEVGELELPVHITVSQHTATQIITAITNQAPTNQQPSVSPTAEPVQIDNTSQGAEGNMEDVHQRSIDVKVLLIPWGMLVVVTAGILVTWKMWTKHKDNKAKDQTTNNSVAPFPEDDDDVTYSTVIPQHKAQINVQTCHDQPDDNVVYSSLALQVTTQQRAAAAQQ